jgi:hypothetical protein
VCGSSVSFEIDLGYANNLMTLSNYSKAHDFIAVPMVSIGTVQW